MCLVLTTMPCSFLYINVVYIRSRYFPFFLFVSAIRKQADGGWCGAVFMWQVFLVPTVCHTPLAWGVRELGHLGPQHAVPSLSPCAECLRRHCHSMHHIPTGQRLLVDPC